MHVKQITAKILPRRLMQLPTTFLLIGLLLVVLTWYVLATNALISMQYTISDHTRKQDAMLAEIEKLETRVADAGRPEALEVKANEFGFIAVKRPTYLSVPGNAVARR